MANREIEIDSQVAMGILEIVGMGNPPEYGSQYFTVGLDDYLSTIDEEYLKTHIMYGGAIFKMVIGTYGGGKTHFLYSIREKAWGYNYISSYISLSPKETPFHKLELVYKAIVANLMYPQTPEELLSGYDRGVEAVIKTWYSQKYQELSAKLSDDAIRKELNSYASSLGSYESTSFRNAVKEAFLCLVEKKENDFTLILQWLKGENSQKNFLNNLGIFEEIDKSTAFRMIRSLIQWIREIGYSGLIMLMDEAEQTSSMSRKEKDTLLSNLRELIDACGHANVKNTMFFYAVPDESFLDGQTQIYVALRQRISGVFDTEINPRGVKIDLEKIPIEAVDMLAEIGRKLARIYEIAYNTPFKPDVLEESIENIANAAYEKKFEIGYKRLFVKSVINAFDILRSSEKLVPIERAREVVDANMH